MNIKKILIIASPIFIVLLGIIFYLTQNLQNIDDIYFVDNFQECLEQGHPIMESYPRQCKTPDGRVFTEEIGNELRNSNEVILYTPDSNALVDSPIKIEGRARGYWFFEGDFPLELIDENGRVIASGIARAQEDWMTENFVNFLAKVEFAKPSTDRGELIFKKDNPSDFPENDEEFRVPLLFNLEGSFKEVLGACKVTGCSGQLCSDKEIFSTCEYKESYTCYKSAICERQQNGECGWTLTPKLAQCLGIAL